MSGGGLRIHQVQAPGLHHPASLELSWGECVALFGASGAGKTRLLRSIADLDPHAGEITLNRRHQQDYEPTDWRTTVGFLPAESAWWFEQVRPHFIGDPAPYLKALELPAAALDWDLERASSGERQRLGLARLLDHDPRVLLLDEPTANLDAENTERVEQLIAAYRQDRQCAVIWVSHDAQQRRRVAERSYRIEDGRLREEAWN